MLIAAERWRLDCHASSSSMLRRQKIARHVVVDPNNTSISLANRLTVSEPISPLILNDNCAHLLDDNP
jgi:hypothetical protein